MSKEVYYSQEGYCFKDEGLASAHWECADCGWSADTAHHLTYEFGVICDPQYLVALCEQCHKVRHGLTNWRWETGPILEKWTVEKCSSAQVKGAEGNEEKSVQ